MTIISSRVPDKLRLDFLPKHFGFPLMLKIESAVYSWMRALCNHYTGGYWQFYDLSNGGIYLAPESGDTFTVTVPSNYFSGQVSADAAGIIATLFALNQLCNKSPNLTLYDKYYLLLDFANEHK